MLLLNCFNSLTQTSKQTIERSTRCSFIADEKQKQKNETCLFIQNIDETCFES